MHLGIEGSKIVRFEIMHLRFQQQIVLEPVLLHILLLILLLLVELLKLLFLLFDLNLHSLSLL